jgi:hypothetical protein
MAPSEELIMEHARLGGFQPTASLKFLRLLICQLQKTQSYLLYSTNFLQPVHAITPGYSVVNENPLPLFR